MVGVLYMYSRKAMPEYSLKINGRTSSVDVPADTPLLWVIREELSLQGTKFGCGVGLCRACTVHLDGAAAPSCQVSVAQAEGRAITTIEGLDSAVGRTLKEAWIELDVPQCGYCQTGQIMSAAALLAKSASPSDAEIDAAMSGNLCRCGTYNRIRAAIHLASNGKDYMGGGQP